MEEEGRHTDPDEPATREALLREVKELRYQLGTLQERASQLNALISNVPGMVYRCRNLPAYPMVSIDGRVEELTGFPRSDLLAEDSSVRYGDIIHPEDRDLVWSGVQSGVEDREDFEFEYRIITAAGEVRWVWERGRLIGLDTDGVELLEGLIVDINKRKEAELGLVERNQFINTILKNLPIGLGVNTMDDGKVVYINPEFTRVYGWPAEELQDVESFFAKVYPDPERRRMIRARVLSDIQSGDPDRMRWEGVEVTRKDGEKRLVTAKNIPIPEQNLMISTVWDTTALARTQRELSEKIDLLRELTEHMESVREQEKLSISREIHDVIGQALTAAHLDLSGIQEKVEDGEVAVGIGGVMELLLEILDNSQNLAKDLRPDMLDLLGLGPTLEYYLPQAAKRTGMESELHFDVPEGRLSPEVSLTTYRLIQEAVTNAVRHSEASRIRVSLEVSGDKLLITVEDNGKGIREEEARDPESWGIVGMRERLLGLGGLLELLGRPGKGTRVRMMIPLRRGPPHSSRA